MKCARGEAAAVAVTCYARYCGENVGVRELVTLPSPGGLVTL